ncbi:ATP-binding protein [Chloroflexota bacterium]
MRNKGNKKWMGAGPYLWRITAIMVSCSIVYYLPSIAGFLGWTSLRDTLNVLHNIYGIDLYALVFFAPVVYAAYMVGVIGAVLVALVSMLVFLPYSIFMTDYPGAMFRPTSFVIILSAVGSVVAMLQKSDEQRRLNMNELRCLYDIGKAAEESASIDQFLASVIELVPQDLQCRGEAKLRIVVEDRMFESPDFVEAVNRVREDLVIGGDVLGYVEIYSTYNSSYLVKRYPFVKTLAERIGGAVRGIELAQSLKGYYEQLEEMVEKRTRDLEQAQDKLIRSEKLAAVGELASGVGHELRNPLNVIRNCVYLLNMTLDGKGNEETASTLKLLDQQVDISNRIVTDLLTFTRVRPPSLAKVNLHHLVKESLSWLAMPGDVVVRNDLNGSSPQVMIDAEQVGRAFANIISNATQALNSDKKEIRITSGVDGECAWVRFEDTGCGIPEGNLDKIFEPLFTTKPKGIGLGLAITKSLIEQSSGAIEVASQVDEGTSFTVRLPLAKKEVKV